MLRKGTILQGVSSGTYPDNNAIPGASVLARLANTNKHLILAPDGADYGRIFDLAIDGNKNNLVGIAFANAGMTSNFRVATANTGLTTTPPATLGPLTASNTAWWLALS